MSSKWPCFHMDKDIKKLANEFTRLISNDIEKEIKNTSNVPGKK